jgi:plastocyanin
VRRGGDVRRAERFGSRTKDHRHGVGIDMMAISQPKATVGAERPQFGRTFAMTVVSAGYGAMTAGLAYLVFLFMRAGDDFRGGALIPVFATITAVVAGVGLVSVVWSGARRRPWFWLVSAVPALFILLMNATYLAYDISRPTITETFLRSLLILAGGLAIIVGAVTAFFEVRRGRPTWTRSGPIGWVSIGVIGVLVGASITSLLAGSASAGGAGVAEEPTVSGVLTVEKSAFGETNLDMNNGEVLGLFVVNKDPFPHSFDIDSLKIHVELLPNSTTAVAIKPTGPGEIEFYCSVPGHVAAGMVGKLSVE